MKRKRKLRSSMPARAPINPYAIVSFCTWFFPFLRLGVASTGNFSSKNHAENNLFPLTGTRGLLWA